jgi:hypothetical protein
MGPGFNAGRALRGVTTGGRLKVGCAALGGAGGRIGVTTAGGRGRLVKVGTRLGATTISGGRAGSVCLGDGGFPPNRSRPGLSGGGGGSWYFRRLHDAAATLAS